MKKFLVYLLICVGISSCRKENSDWLQQMKVPCDENTICKTSIYKAIYNHEPVVYSILSGALCDPYFSVQLHNLNGDVIKSYSGPNDLSAFGKEVTDQILIYTCH